jgi:protein phosphatase PTC1
MVVRFDGKTMKETVEHKVDPIGVDGDPTSATGGVSEADAIVGEAGKKAHIPEGINVEDEVNKVSREIIQDQEDQGAAPGLNLASAKKAETKAKT